MRGRLEVGSTSANGMLLLIHPVVPFASKGQQRWLVQCKFCDSRRVKLISFTKFQKTKSCGCQRSKVSAETMRKSMFKHGLKGTTEYNRWVMLRQRCYNPNNVKYPDYGGRGIRVCPEWKADFKAFLGYVGLCPGAGYSIDRIDNDGNYEPGNVRWATAKQQANNRRKRKQAWAKLR